MTIILLTLFTIFSFLLFIIFRIDKINKHDSDIINIIYTFNDYKWRRDYYRTISSKQKVLKFWKPLDSFYKDKAFLRK